MSDYKSYWTVRRRISSSVDKQCLAIALERQEIIISDQGQTVFNDETDCDDLLIYMIGPAMFIFIVKVLIHLIMMRVL